MQTIWKGSIAFGLVTIPVKLYSATEEHSVGLHQVRSSDGSRIRYRRVAEADEAEVPYAQISKGYELPSGETVVLTDTDLASLPVATTHTIEVLQFVESTQIDPVHFQKTYYLEPDKTGVKPYVLLRDALAGAGSVGLVKVAIRQRESLAVLRVRDGVFALTTMLWPDEVRQPDFAFLREEVSISAGERKIAEQLIGAMTADFEPGEHKDTYAAALRQLIDAKAEGRDVVRAPEAEETAEVVDLMSALQASLDAKADTKERHPAGKRKAPAKKKTA